ncbi:MAG TPA: flagellar hook-length control protein FliK, partial [Kiloniellaceae bacterium]
TGKAAAAEVTPAAAEGEQAAATAKPAANAGQTATAKVSELPAASIKKFSGGAAATPSVSTDPAGMSPTPGTAAPAITAGGTTPLHNVSFADTLAQARHGAPANPAEQIAVQVQRAQVAGQDQISIKLHPAELGRIEVKLENASDGTLRAVISAERTETLDLLQRDARGLERALQEAGVKTDSGSLSFNLRGQGQNHEQQAGNGGSGRGAPAAETTGDSQAAAAQPQPYRSSHSGALDIRV